jgi:beta-N-acetylhexosaminidase
MRKRVFSRYISNWRVVVAGALFLFATLVATPVSDALAASANQRRIFGAGISQYNVDNGECDVSTGLQLTDDQKISATFIVGFNGNKTDGVESIVSQYRIGGVYTTESQTADKNGYDKAFYDSLVSAAGHTMIISNDNEGGQIKRDSFTIPESAQALAGLSDDSEITAKVGAMAKAMKDNGENTDLAPVLDLVGVGAKDRHFSPDPNVVKDKARLYAMALSTNGIAPVFKHFPGFDDKIGTQNTDTGKVVLSTDLNTLKSRNIAPYSLATEVSMSKIMLSNLYTQLDPSNMASTSKVTVDYIRNDLGFKGIIMTDSLSGPSNPAYYAGSPGLPTLVANALAAGVTMPMFEYAGGAADFGAIITAVKANPDAMANIDSNLQLLYGSSATSGGGGGGGGSGDLSGSAPTSLTGSTNQEKTWNYFKSRGLTDVAAAGAMGNMEQEDSTFNPYLGEGGDTSWNQSVENKGFGLIQWTNTGGAGAKGRRGRIIQHLIDNGISTPDPAKVDDALLLELNWLWDGEYGKMTWQEPLNDETTVDGDPSVSFSANNVGNGSAMLFHALVERSADDTTGKQQRIDSAKKFLDQFGGTGGGGNNCSDSGDGGGADVITSLDQFELFEFDQPTSWGGINLTMCKEGRTLGSAGCGIYAMANIMKSFGKTVDPITIVSEMEAANTNYCTMSDTDAIGNIANFYGVKAGEVKWTPFGQATIDEIEAALKAGKRVIADGPSGEVFKASSDGHYIAFMGIDSSGNWLIGDSGHAPHKRTAAPQDVISVMKYYSIISKE